jgi:quinol monooxygenase YgiN
MRWLRLLLSWPDAGAGWLAALNRTLRERLVPGCRERGASSVLGSEQPTRLHDVEEGNDGYDRASGHRPVSVPRRRCRGVQALVRAVHEIVRTQDIGTLQYDTYFNDYESECIVIERFRDSDALIQHGENLAHLLDAITATGSVSGELLGDPSAELRAEDHRRRPVQLFTPWATM